MALLALFDVVPAYWGAEPVGGHSLWRVRIVTGLLVLSITLSAVLLSHFRHPRRHARMFAAALLLAAVLVGIQTGLRLEYLLTTSKQHHLSVTIGLEIALLACITSALVWVGYVVLRRAESLVLLRHRLVVERLEARLEQARAQLTSTAHTYFDNLEALRHHERSRIGEEAKLDADVSDELTGGDNLEAARIKLANEGPPTDEPSGDRGSNAAPPPPSTPPSDPSDT